MATKKVLITGVSGFVGRNVAKTLLHKKYEVTGIVRPKTNPARLKELSTHIGIVELDLTDIPTLKKFLAEYRFDVILHIGALRGGRKFSDDEYYKANVDATEQLVINSLRDDSLFIFCSSVGVYGAIPNELPANIQTEFQNDNYYHYTKIMAEKIIQREVINGLRAVIVRPAIVYGEGDYGFPYTLTKLIDKKLFFLPDTTIRIHLANIEIVKDVFYKLAEAEYQGHKVYNVADREPVIFKDLVDFISERLTGKKYSDKRSVSLNYFRKAEKFAYRFGLSNFLNRIRLISHSWFFDVNNTYKDLYLGNVKTIPSFGTVVDWYKGIK